MTELKTVTLEVIKKNRVYFKCLTKSGHEVKLRITPKSENLSLGIQDLLVKDESVRTKYGTDIIYSLESEIRDIGVCTLKSEYNENLVAKCRDLGGRWDSDQKVWVFSKIVEAEVEALDELYNTNIVTVEAEVISDRQVCCGTIDFLGKVLAKARDRDSGAVLGDNVSLIKGDIDSGGSSKNWTTTATSGTVFRFQISKNLIEKITEFKLWKVTILNEGDLK